MINFENIAVGDSKGITAFEWKLETMIVATGIGIKEFDQKNWIH